MLPYVATFFNVLLYFVTCRNILRKLSRESWLGGIAPLLRRPRLSRHRLGAFKSQPQSVLRCHSLISHIHNERGIIPEGSCRDLYLPSCIVEDLQTNNPLEPRTGHVCTKCRRQKSHSDGCICQYRSLLLLLLLLLLWLQMVVLLLLLILLLLWLQKSHSDGCTCLYRSSSFVCIYVSGQLYTYVNQQTNRYIDRQTNKCLHLHTTSATFRKTSQYNMRGVVARVVAKERGRCVRVCSMY